MNCKFIQHKPNAASQRYLKPSIWSQMSADGLKNPQERYLLSPKDSEAATSSNTKYLPN
jgi:hypothetical protein